RRPSLVVRGHALEHDVLRLGLEPLGDERLHRVAMRAAVPEEFRDLDLAAAFGGLRRAERRVERRLRERLGRERGDAEEGEENRKRFANLHLVSSAYWVFASSVARMM